MPSYTHRCDHCFHPCEGLRCTGCKRAIYCSRKCQRAHWKLVHKFTCAIKQSCNDGDVCPSVIDNSIKDSRQEVDRSVNVSKRVAAAAMSELRDELSSMSMNSAGEFMHRAQDEIVRIEDVNRQLEKSKILKERMKTRIETCVDGNANALQEEKKHNFATILFLLEKEWNVLVEELRHIGTFCVTLSFVDGPRWDGAEMDIEYEVIHESGRRRCYAMSIIYKCTRRRVLTIEMPRNIDLSSSSISWDKNGYIIARLPYTDKFDQADILTSNGPIEGTLMEDVKNLQCRNCCKRLIASVKNDDKCSTNFFRNRTILLPAGYWESISDYITCYDENPNMFSSSATQGFVFENNAVFVFHEEDLGNDSIIIRPVEGFGEDSNIEGTATVSNRIVMQDGAEFRGEREWTNEIEGATVCCKQCESVLGYADTMANGTIRLYKHLLKTNEATLPPTPSQQSFYRFSCGTFIANEMVRYADSQAVYTFVVNVQGKESFGQSIMLRLVSWDSLIAMVVKDSTCNNFVCSDAVKIIYEERLELPSSESTKTNFDSNDPNTWKWGNLSFCCPPGTKEIHGVDDGSKEALVRIYLPLNKWNDLRNELEANCSLFQESVVDVTVKLKLGTADSKKAKLSVLKLT